MIVRVIESGSDLPGLAAYMWGPGKAEEHTNQHMIASTGAGEQRIGDASFFFAGEQAVRLGDATLESADAREEGRKIERHWRHFREQSKTPAMAAVGAVNAPSDGRTPDFPDAGPDAHRVDPEFASPNRQGRTGWNRPHVMHVSFSLREDEGQLSDETWARIAADYVDRMGFSGADGKPGCEWAAWRHGVSKAGNDHMHVGISLVKSDGRWANEYRSKMRSRDICDDLEKKYGLRPAKDSPQQRGMPGRGKAEDHRHRRDAKGAGGERERIAMVVRRAATRAGTEQQFIAEVLRQGVRVRPHYAKGGREEVVGASFKERSGDGNWIGGGRLGRDLSLPKLRATWDDSPQRRAEALPVWQGSKHVPRQQKAGSFEPSLNAAHRALAAWATDVEKLNPHDENAWAKTAREAATVASELAQGSGGQQREYMAALAHECARAAQQRRQHESPTADHVRVACRHMSLSLRAGSRSSAAGWLAVMQQFHRVSKAINSAQRARGEQVRAARLEQSTRAHLQPVIAGLEKARPRTAPTATVPRTINTKNPTRDEERGR